MRIISREEAGLRPPRSVHRIATPTPRLWLHHTAGALDQGGNGVWWDDVRGIQDFHMDGRGWTDIAYSFLVGGGQIFEGRGAGIAGGHTKGDNTLSHAICLIGNYETMQPTDDDLEAIAWLIGHGREQGWWGDLTGSHSEAPGASTACCGRHLRARIPDLRRLAANPQERDDMYDQAARDELIKRIDELRTESDANWKRLVSLETSMAWVGGVLADLAGRSTTVNVDAAAVAAAIPDDLAQQVADVLAERLAG